jgi:hypothetical protein
MRVLAVFSATVFAVTATLALAAAVFAGEGKKGGHPHFDDQGTLAWSVKLADAQTAAKAADKLIFIEFGREA